MKTIWKRLLCIGLALVLVLGCLPAAVLAAEPEAIPYQYTSNEGGNIQENDTFVWRDCFLRSSFAGCDHLRLLSAQAAIASASRYGAGAFDPYEQDHGDMGYNIRKMLTDMGFEDVKTNAYYRTANLEDSAAATVGRRTVHVDGEPYTLLAIIPRSAGYQLEWVGNFTVGDGNKLHAGFKAARDEVLRFVKQYIADEGIEGKLKVWIAGHSRGAAISNQLGGFFAGGGIAYFGEGVSITPEDVYCYTFATPRTVVAGLKKADELSVAGDRGGVYAGFDTKGAAYTYAGADADAAVDDPEGADIYRGIRNYPLSYDLITSLPPALWGFTNYGGTFSMSETDTGSVDADEMLSQMAAVSSFVFRKWTAGAYPAEDPAAYPGDYRSFRPLDFDLASMSLVPAAGAAGEAGMTEYFRARINGMAAAISDGSADGGYQSGASLQFQEAMGSLVYLLWITSLEFREELTETSNAAIQPAILSYLDYAYQCMHAADSSVTEVEAAKRALIELADHFTGAQHDPEAIRALSLSETAAAALSDLLRCVSGEPLSTEPFTVDALIALFGRYVYKNRDAAKTLLTPLAARIAPKTAATLRTFLAAFAPRDVAKPGLDDMLAGLLMACAYGADWQTAPDADKGRQLRSELYQMLAILPYIRKDIELPPLLLQATANGGTMPVSQLIDTLLPTYLGGTVLCGGTTSLADAADAGFRAALTALIDKVTATIRGGGIYDEDYRAEFIAALEKHRDILLATEPNRMAMVRKALCGGLFYNGGAFDTDKNVQNVCTLVGNISRIPPAHYCETFVAWAKAAAARGAKAQDITPAVSIESWKSGETPAVPVVTGNPGGGEVTFAYALRGSGEYSAAVPTEPGNYTVRATVEATHDYNGAVAAADFSISGSSGGTPSGDTPSGGIPSGSSTPAGPSGSESGAGDKEQTGDKSAEETPDAACPRDATCPISAYSDADPAAWYHDGIHFCLENGIMQGVGEGRFAPDAPASRAMMAQILYNMEGRPMIRSGIPFDDVTESDWFAMAVSWAESQGILGGYGNGKFGPGDDVTREMLVTILYRYAQYKGMDVSAAERTSLEGFDDVAAVSEWALSAMRWAVGTGLITGRTPTALAPAERASRAEIATIIMRFFSA